MKTFYVTTPLYYVNAKPHLGHTYTTIVADSLGRYMEMQGNEVCFLTGTDEHGQNIERAAAAQGITPQELADRNTAEYKQLWARFGIEYHRFIRTTDIQHFAGASEIFRRAWQNGYIYKGEYSGWYCIPCNLFAPESETAPNCEVCGRLTERVTEESYFFKLSEFQKPLLDHYAKNPKFVLPTSRRNEVVSFVSGGLKDLSVSRTSVRWGIPVPSDNNHVIYVWFDALVGYLTGIGFGNPARDGEFHKYWPAQVQLIGKDIIRFHTVYWPAFLMAAGLDLPQRVFAHGWWLKDEAKMSKSRGNIVEPNLLLDHFGSDAVRYFVLREVPLGLDGTFSYEALIQRVNSDLANDYGNLVSRTLTLISKTFNHSVPYPSAIEGRTSQDKELEQAAMASIASFQDHMNELAFSKALEAVWDLLAKTNRYLNDSSPWSLTEDLSQRPRLATILYTSAEIIRITTILLASVLPESCKLVWKQLGFQTSLKAQRLGDLKWGGLPVGAQLGEITPVFPRLDKKTILDKIAQAEAVETVGAAPDLSKPADKPVKMAGGGMDKPPRVPASSNAEPSTVAGTEKEKISIDDFSRIDLRVGQVVSAEKVRGADKLLRLMVDLGTENRQILAGIAMVYSPESLIGRKVVIVANLEPRKLRGLESNGMLLAASVGDEGKPVLAGFLEDVPNGAKLK